MERNVVYSSEEARLKDLARIEAIHKGFAALLEKYDMPKQADWEFLCYWLDEIGGSPVDIMDLGLLGVQYVDWDELIRLIKLLESSKEVDISNAIGIKVSLNDENLKRYLILSLHKLLYLATRMDNPSKEEAQRGEHTIWRFGKQYTIKLKKPLEGERGDYVEPFSSEELDKLLEMNAPLKAFKHKARAKGKYTPLLGDRVAEVLTYIPDEAYLGKSKTDMLNFAGELLELAGVLDVAPKWLELSRAMAMAENNGLLVGDYRRQRQKMLMNWLRSGKKLFCKGDSSLECDEEACDWYPVCKGRVTKYLKLLE